MACEMRSVLHPRSFALLCCLPTRGSSGLMLNANSVRRHFIGSPQGKRSRLSILDKKIFDTLFGRKATANRHICSRAHCRRRRRQQTARLSETTGGSNENAPREDCSPPSAKISVSTAA